MLLGVAEGVSELVPEKALPFEFNLDYMNGGIYVHVRAETIAHFVVPSIEYSVYLFKSQNSDCIKLWISKNYILLISMPMYL